MAKKSYLTINTDASFCSKQGAAGYAFYIVCDMFKIQKGGHFKSCPPDAMAAEIMCIGNALASVLQQKELPSIDVIVINSDCLYGMDRIRLTHKHNDPRLRTVRSVIGKLKARLGGKVEISFRHVKAHNGTPDARSWVNDWCDTEAKKWMRVKRTQLSNLKSNR